MFVHSSFFVWKGWMAMQRTCLWRAISLFATLLILNEVFVSSSWRTYGRILALVFSGMYFLWLHRGAIAPCITGKKTRKKGKKSMVYQVEPDYKKLFVQQAMLHIQERLKEKFTDASACICEADILRLVNRKDMLFVSIEGVEGFSHMNITMSEDGIFHLNLFSLINLDTIVSHKSEKGENSLEEKELERWYSLKGQRLLTELVTEMNGQGYSKLSIQENGDVVVQENGKYVVKDQITDFPSKKNWIVLKQLMLDSGIRVRVNDKKMTFSW